MDGNPLEMRDDEINVEEIIAKTRENIRRRKTEGDLPLDLNSLIVSTSKICNPDISNASFQDDLSFINANWNIYNNCYFIRSHRHPLIGKLLVKGRQLVHGEVRRYIDPVISRQTEFNAVTVRILNGTLQKCAVTDLKFSQQWEELNRNFSRQEDELTRKISQREDELTRKISQREDELTRKISQREDELTRKISQREDELTANIQIYVQKHCDEIFSGIDKDPWLRTGLAHLFDELTQKFSRQEDALTRKISQQEEELNAAIHINIDKNFDKVFSHFDKDLRLRMGLAHLFEERIQKGLAQKSTAPESVSPPETNYFLFEDQFRGTREDIKQRQLAFLPYFETCSHVLDIGCGRGEFLEILKDNNIGVIGVDLDADMVSCCKSLQLDVVQSDALSYMESLENNSLDGIFIDQVVEHLEPAYLVRLLALCHQKLKSGYYLVVETVNPLSFISFANFYIDLTHTRPVHPATLQFLISAAGFTVCEKKFSSPVPEDGRLKKIAGDADMNETERKDIDIYNRNVELLNSVLFGAQDYAVIGKK